ncbi:MAG: hypothetical protein WDO12_03335 [Pseudomonadota bacterium]
MIPHRKKPTFLSPEECPQVGRERMAMQQPLANFTAEGVNEPEAAMLRHMAETGAVFMMGQNPKLPVMPEKPKLLDFFHYRFCDIAFRHLLQSAKTALDAGQSETIVIACLLHDISNGAFLRTGPRLLGRADDCAVCHGRSGVGGAEPPGAALLRG